MSELDRLAKKVSSIVDEDGWLIRPNEGAYGSHWGLTDWYGELEDAVKAALKLGAQIPWGVKWGAKKEIVYAQITHIAGGYIALRVRVYDDFDTLGMAADGFTRDKKASPEDIIEKMKEMLSLLWDAAVEEQKENRNYAGFTIASDGIWEYTYISPFNLGWERDCPPGDYYHKWGWQEDVNEMPLKDIEEAEKWIEEYVERPNLGETSFTTSGGWSVIAWK